MSGPARVLFTPAALALVRRLKAEHGPLLFHQSGGCCDGSSPLCFRRNDFRVGSRDVLLGIVDGCPFYISAPQFAAGWSHTQLIIDVVSTSSESFSIEAPDGVRFVTGSRVFTEAELAELAAAGPPPAGPCDELVAAAESATPGAGA